MDNDPVDTIWYLKLHFDGHLHSWIILTIKSQKIGIQQILIKSLVYSESWYFHMLYNMSTIYMGRFRKWDHIFMNFKYVSCSVWKSLSMWLKTRKPSVFMHINFVYIVCCSSYHYFVNVNMAHFFSNNKSLTV